MARRREIGQGHPLPSQWMRGGAHAHNGIPGQGEEPKGPGSSPGCDETNVGHAIEEHGDDFVRVGVAQFDAPVQVAQSRQYEWHNAMRKGHMDGDAKARRIVELANGVDRFIQEIDRAMGIGEEMLARRGQRRAAGASVEQGGTDLAFETGHPLADRRLRHQERTGGATEAPLAGHGKKGGQIIGP